MLDIVIFATPSAQIDCEWLKEYMNIWVFVMTLRGGLQFVHNVIIAMAAIGLYRENAIAVRVIDRSAYDATSRVHAHRQRKNMSYLRNGCCIYYLRPTGSAHL